MKLFWRFIKRRALSSLARWQSVEEVSTDKVLENPRPQSLADNLADRAVVILPQCGDKYERQSSFESQPSNVAKAEKTSTVWKTTLEGEETKTWNE